MTLKEVIGLSFQERGESNCLKVAEAAAMMDDVRGTNLRSFKLISSHSRLHLLSLTRAPRML